MVIGERPLRVAIGEDDVLLREAVLTDVRADDRRP
jgi:hypothetical protein